MVGRRRAGDPASVQLASGHGARLPAPGITGEAQDLVKAEYGTKIVAVEALECPTMLENGFGEHNIQGIGDKHIPIIHNVMNTDVVVAISDKATDELDALFNTDTGRQYLTQSKGVPADVVATLEAIYPKFVLALDDSPATAAALTVRAVADAIVRFVPGADAGTVAFSSGSVGPRPLGYCSVTSTGTARRCAACSRSLPWRVS